MKEIGIPRIFADTSKIPEIEAMNKTSLIYGITSNPLIVASEAKNSNDPDPIKYYEKLARQFPDLPVSIQLLNNPGQNDVTGLMEQAKKYASISPNVVIKVPFFGDGRETAIIARLVKENIKVNVTALMNSEQALLALMAGNQSNAKGPDYLSLFFNRIKDGGGNPRKEIRLTRLLLNLTGSDSQIIAGSIRQGSDIYEASISGAHITTVTPKIFWKTLFHQKSDEFIQQSQKAWEEYLANTK